MKVEEELAPSSAPDEQSTNGSPPSIDLPESRGYRLKKGLLGPPLHTERLAHERLGKPTALAVFASDNLSSVAYGTEEIIRHLVPYIGIAAFALVMPTTIALLVVLGFLIVGLGPALGLLDPLEVHLTPGLQVDFLDVTVEILDLQALGVLVHRQHAEGFFFFEVLVPLARHRLVISAHRQNHPVIIFRPR